MDTRLVRLMFGPLPSLRASSAPKPPNPRSLVVASLASAWADAQARAAAQAVRANPPSQAAAAAHQEAAAGRAEHLQEHLTEYCWAQSFLARQPVLEPTTANLEPNKQPFTSNNDS